MKQRLFFIVLLVLNFFGVYSQQIYYVAANLNLRMGPSTIYQVVTVIPKGDAVNTLSDNNSNWVYVQYGNMSGFVSTRYLSKQKLSNSTSNVQYYTNSMGHIVQSPTYYNNKPNGACARCRDGSYSFSESRRGTCSHHGGVAVWY